MTPEERTACVAALDAAERAAQALRAILSTAEAMPAEPANAVPLAVACRAWGCSKDAGRKRARRGVGFKYGGRWYVAGEAFSKPGSHPRPRI